MDGEGKRVAKRIFFKNRFLRENMSPEIDLWRDLSKTTQNFQTKSSKHFNKLKFSNHDQMCSKAAMAMQSSNKDCNKYGCRLIPISNPESESDYKS